MFDPKNKGFFPMYYEKYSHLLLKSDVIISPNSLEVKLKNIWSLLEAEKPFKNIKCLYGNKSDKKSAHLRGIGNSYFYEGDYPNALLQYSLAVFTASYGKCDFALALANRSAVLQKLSRFAESLTDIDFCLNCGSYPKEKVFKLHERQAEIYETMILRGNDEKVLITKLESVVSSALESIGLSDLNQEKKTKFCNNIKQKLDTKVPNNIESNKKISNTTKSYEDTTNEAMEIHYEEGRGRYMVATRDIQPGETIILETPGSFSLYPNKFGTHCLNCFKIVSGTVYPCEKCMWVSFCCLKCKKEAMSFHQYECGIDKWFLTSGLNIYPFLVLRTITKLGPSKLKELRPNLFKERDESKEPKVFTEEDIFLSIFQLNCHEEFLTVEDWCLRGFISLYILHCLKVSGFLNDDKADGFNDEEFFIGSVILRLLNICPSNCHDISEYITPIKGEFPVNCEKSSLGAGIYPLLAMFNHSCDPSFMRCNIGNKVWCVSSKTIKKGEEVFENYGIMYTVKQKEERQLILKKHYKFDCHCPACTENWPDTVTMKQRINNYSSDRFDHIFCRQCLSVLVRENKRSSVINCLYCGAQNDINHLDLKEFMEISKDCENLFTKGKWTQGLSKFKTADVMLFKKLLKLPFYDFTQMQISLWKGMWLERGNIRYAKII